MVPDEIWRVIVTAALVVYGYDPPGLVFSKGNSHGPRASFQTTGHICIVTDIEND